jgi:hypothetical protein
VTVLPSNGEHHTSRLRKNHFGIAELCWPTGLGNEEYAPAGCSKRPDFPPVQPRRAKTRRSAGKAAASETVMHTLFGTASPSERNENVAGGLFQRHAREI